MFFRSAKRMTAPEPVTGKIVPQEVLLAKVAETVQADIHVQQQAQESPDDMSADDLADCCLPVPSAMDDIAHADFLHTALLLHSLITNIENSLPVTPSPKDLANKDVDISQPALYNFLCLVLRGGACLSTVDGRLLDNRVSAPTPTTHCTIVSILLKTLSAELPKGTSAHLNTLHCHSL